MSDNTALTAQAATARQVLQDILTHMSFPAQVEVEESEEQIALTITSDQPLGLLIGRGGQTLNAVEMIVSVIVQHKTHVYGKRIVIDAEGYRRRQTERLEEIAREAVARALETNEPVPLEPMNARDRRTVHMAALELGAVETYSVGEEPYRHIVIAPAGQGRPDEGDE